MTAWEGPMAGPSWSVMTQFVFVVPPVIAYIIGLVLAFQRRRDHPYSAGLATWGFMILLVETLFFSCIRTFLFFDPGGVALSGYDYGLIFTGVAGLQTVFFTLGIGLVIGAIFSDRRSVPPSRRRVEPDDFDAPPARPRDVPRPAPVDQPETFREKRES